uniref:Lipoprotein n=1 Tax=Pseudomonas graminis TaxID=158627 RepID=A0A7C1WQ24_9PSED
MTVSVLGGCATGTTSPEPGKSIVNIEAHAGDDMIARRLDGNQAQHLNHFIVSPGRHSMELGIVMIGYQNSHRRCTATLDYANFAADQRYTLVQSRADGEVKVSLMDSRGVAVAQAGKVPCL